MTPNLLAKMFGWNSSTLKKNTEGLTHEDSLVHPQNGGNCLNWILGHIVFTRNSALELVGESRIWSKEDGSLYKRGSEPIQPGDNVYPLEKLLEDYDTSQERLIPTLNKMSGEDFETMIGEVTVAQRLSFLQFHEAYHIGQTAILRRIAGKAGAI